MKTSTGYSPFQLVYGIESTFPIHFDLPTFQSIHRRLKKAQGGDAEKSRKEQLMELEEARAVAMVRVEQAQRKQKESYDKRQGKKKVEPFKEGDWVMLFDSI